MTSDQSKTSSNKTDSGFLTPVELSQALAVPVATLAFWRTTKQGPAFLKIGRHVRYDVKDVTAWLHQRKGGADA